MPFVSLRPVSEEDAERMLVWRAEPSASRYQPLRQIGLDELKALIGTRNRAEFGPDTYGVFQWIVLADDAPSGWISLKIDPADRAHGIASIGYTIGEAFRGQRVGQTALSQLVEIAFDRSQFALDRLEAVAAVDNVPSRCVLERNGFRFEGIQRGLLQIHGYRVDHAMYGLLRSDREERYGQGGRTLYDAERQPADVGASTRGGDRRTRFDG